MLHAAVRSQEVNPGKLTLLFRKQFELCKVTPGETSKRASRPPVE